MCFCLFFGRILGLIALLSKLTDLYKKTIFLLLRLACLALQMENIVQKITKPIFVFGNFINQNRNRKMGWNTLIFVFICIRTEVKIFWERSQNLKKIFQFVLTLLLKAWFVWILRSKQWTFWNAFPLFFFFFFNFLGKRL